MPSPDFVRPPWNNNAKRTNLAEEDAGPDGGHPGSSTLSSITLRWSVASALSYKYNSRVLVCALLASTKKGTQIDMFSDQPLGSTDLVFVVRADLKDHLANV